jgi:uncharacterized membrane protein YdjX (TVP38/TMEM64 family)
LEVDRRGFGRLAFLAAVTAVLAAAFLSPLGDALTPERLAASLEALSAAVEARPLLSVAAFILLCVAASALCFPIAPLLGIAAGALFGFWAGLAALALAFTLGSTFSFLASRHLLRQWVKAKLGARLDAVDGGFERHGAAYLLALRINPFIPYWLVNLAVGATAMRTRAYVPLTALGLLPALALYAAAGSRLSAASGAGDLFSPAIVAALLALSLVPLAAERLRTGTIAA